MPTTSNFGWTTPADTDLVKDGAAAIRTLGNGIDTSLVDLKGGTTNQVLAKNSNTDLDFKWVADATGIPATIFDAKGDIIAATAADTAARLAVGANGTVLTANSSTATGLEWAAAAGWNPNFTLLNAGGTALTSGTSVTVSGISGRNALFIQFDGASTSNSNAQMLIRFNADSTASNYDQTYMRNSDGTLTGFVGINDFSGFFLGNTGNNAANIAHGNLYIYGTNATGIKPVVFNGGGLASQTGFSQSQGVGMYLGTSTISSVTIAASTGVFDAGTLFVYGA